MITETEESFRGRRVRYPQPSGSWAGTPSPDVASLTGAAAACYPERISFVSQTHPKENTIMRRSSGFRAALIALTVAFAGAGLSSAARADGGTISFKVIKGGWVVGASGGSGTLTFHGQHYPISIGGLSYGIVFGASETFFHGSVSHINSPSDVSGIYGAAGAGAAVGSGAQAIVLTNEKGAVLSLTGRQVGLQINADLSGLSISVR